MRLKAISKKRTILLLILALLTVILFFAETYPTFLIRGAKAYLVKHLGEEFGQDVSIDSIEGGIIRKFVLKDFVLAKKNNGKNAKLFSVERAYVDYRIWNFFRKSGFPSKIILISPRIHLSNFSNVNNQTKNGTVSNYCLPKDMRLKIVQGSILFDGNTTVIEKLNGCVNISRDEIIFDNMDCTAGGVPIFIKGRVFSFDRGPKFDIQVDSRMLDTFFNINGRVDNFIIWGIADLLNRSKIHLLGEAALNGKRLMIKNIDFGKQVKMSGRVDFREQKIMLNALVLGGDIELNIDFSNSDFTRAKAKIKDLHFNSYQLSTDLEFLSIVLRGDRTDAQVQGKLSTTNTEINRKPFKEVNGEFILYKNYLEIKKLTIGRDYILNGRAGLIEPYELNLQLNIVNADVSDLLILGKTDSTTPLVSGIMDGWMEFKGNANRLKSRGHFEGKDGIIGTMKYSRTNLNVMGYYPILKVVNSRAYQRDSYLEIKGEFDFRRIGQDTMLKDIKITPGEKMTVFDQ
ncbi:MAG: hypothetical protein ABH952_03060 [Candidatus Omnitrophota bacterium]